MMKHASAHLSVLGRAAFFVALALTPFLSGGCAILGAVAYKVSGPVKVPPEYVLANEPTLVLADRTSNRGEFEIEGHQISAVVTRLLKESKTPPTLVDPGLAVNRRSEASGRQLSPAELARDCGAKQVIFIDIKRLNQTQSLAGDAIDAQLELAVWVFDANTAAARWPQETNVGRAVTVVLPFAPIKGADTREAVRQQAINDAGRKIARIFTGWTDEQ